MEESRRTDRRADDEALLGHLGRMLAEVDPAPSTGPAEVLLSWRTVDAELAGLLQVGRVAAPRATH